MSTSNKISQVIKKVSNLTKERDRASAKVQKSWGSKTNEMVRIIKEQALKCEEERHWLMSKLVKLTSINQVLEREVEAEVKYGPYSIFCMPLRCNLMTGVDCGWWGLQQQLTQKDERFPSYFNSNVTNTGQNSVAGTLFMRARLFTVLEALAGYFEGWESQKCNKYKQNGGIKAVFVALFWAHKRRVWGTLWGT
ncbi:hypothetical protein BY996DRAFT_8683516 [Phakopsora pachyrhizi]|nr:hypothetical protein BY996DRAFT_8683516 [Phakopsora pachyrhizi]